MFFSSDRRTFRVGKIYIRAERKIHAVYRTAAVNVFGKEYHLARFCKRIRIIGAQSQLRIKLRLEHGEIYGIAGNRRKFVRKHLMRQVFPAGENRNYIPVVTAELRAAVNNRRAVFRRYRVEYTVRIAECYRIRIYGLRKYGINRHIAVRRKRFRIAVGHRTPALEFIRELRRRRFFGRLSVVNDLRLILYFTSTQNNAVRAYKSHGERVRQYFETQQHIQTRPVIVFGNARTRIVCAFFRRYCGNKLSVFYV